MYIIKKRGKIRKVSKHEFENGLKQEGWVLIKEIADGNDLLTQEQKEKLSLINSLDLETLKKLAGGSGDGADDNKDVNIDDMTVEQLKAFLTENKVEFKASATKTELADLAKQVGN